MNIYNNSTIGTNTYPTNATFTAIETTDLQIDSTLTIQGADKGGLLVCENNTNDIGQIDIGDQNMVLASDKNNTELPIWTDSITLNTGTFNGLNLIGVDTGDILVGSGTNAIGRLPVGLNDQVLFSNGTTVGWQYLNALKNVVYFGGAINNINTSRSITFGDGSVNVVAGRRYRIMVSAKLLVSSSVLLYFTVSGIVVRDSFYTASGTYNTMLVVTAISTGPLVIFIEGETLSGTASLLDIYTTIEEY